MKMRILFLAIVVFAISGMAAAGLWDPAILNPSFENITPAAGDGPEWGYVIDDWFEDENGGTARNFWENGAAIGLAGDGDRWAGTETNGAYYQAIGTVDEGTKYIVTSLIGARSGNFGTGSFSLFAGGVEDDGADGVLIESFATQIDSVEVTVADGTEVGTNVYEVTVELSIGSGHAGELLWLQFKSVAGKDYFDNIRIERGSDLIAKAPDPANEATEVNPDQIVLSWFGPGDYVATGYDAYLGTDSNDLSPNYFGNFKVVDNEDVMSYGPVDLKYDTTYFWQVDSYDPNDGAPVVRAGDAWSFTTDMHPSQKGLADGTVPAGLSLANASFESITVTGTDGPDWGYDIDYWYEDGNCYWENGAAISLAGDLDRWAGLGTGGSYYQNIGTVVPGQTYAVRMLIGARGGAFGTGAVSFYAGGSDINAGTDVALDGFATELDTATFVMSDGIEVSTNVNEVSVILSVPADAPAGETLWFLFKTLGGRCYMDNIKFYEPLDSRAVWGPAPAVGDIGVGVQTGTVLSWQAGVDDVNYETLAGITDYNVYASTDRNAVIEATTSTPDVYKGSTGGATEMSVTVPSDSTIHWRVDEVINGETLKGRIWSFETELLLATILEQPVSAVIDSGATAELSVLVDSFSTESYSWKQVTENGDIEVGTGSVLEIGDAGAYYCVITNNAGDVETGTVHVTIKQLMGAWSFDGDLVSSVDAAHAGTVASDNYTDDAVSGQAWEFFGDPNMIIIDNSADDYNFYSQGYTLSAWIKTTQSGWGAYVAKQDKTSGNKGFILTHAGNSGITTLRESFNDLSSGDVGVADGEWHQVMGTFNAQTGVAQVFVDGVLANTSSDNFPNLTLTDVPLFFGGETTDGAVAFVGLLDEVKIWNFALNAYEVAGEYTGVRTDVTICVEIDQFDFNEDCVVDLADFAAFAAAWMDCNLVPCIR